MLLNDIGKSPDATFRRINQHLEQNYGFKISEDVSDKDLVAIMEQIQDEITGLKIKGDDSKGSPEISKRLLVLEGIRSLREFAMVQFQSPKLNGVVKNLVDFVVDTFEISGYHGQQDFEKAVGNAMDEYRSSRYRFPDDMIEQRVRQEAMAAIQSAQSIDDASQPAEPEMQPGMEDEIADEGATWGTIGRRASALGGHALGDIETPKAQKALKSLDNPTLSISDAPGKEQVAMVRDKSGRMVPDPFAAQKAARRGQGIVHESGDPMPMTCKELIVWGYDNGYSDAKIFGKWGRDTGFVDLSDALKAAGDMFDELDIPVQNAYEAIWQMYDRMHNGTNESTKFESRKGIMMKEHANLVKNLRHLLETEVSQAEVMMAAKGFAQELQEMVEKIGRLQNEDLPPVTDQMRETYGMESASAFQTQIYGALQGVMDALYTAKNQVDDAVGSMATSGQVGMPTDMDADVGMDAEMGMEEPTGMDAEVDLDNIESDIEGEDEFGGEEPLGRSKKMESAVLKRKILEMQKLVNKAKKIREAKA